MLNNKNNNNNNNSNNDTYENNNNKRNDYTFPVGRLGVHLAHANLVTIYCSQIGIHTGEITHREEEMRRQQTRSACTHSVTICKTAYTHLCYNTL
jgi:hypothetical protein